MNEEISALVNAAFAEAMSGFEHRLASSMQKALDIVTAQQEQRIRALEEDLAKVIRHTGL